MEFVEALSRRWGEGVRIRERIGTLLEQRLQVLRDESLGLLATLPHIQNPEQAGLIVEAGRVCDQPVERSVADFLGYEVVVRGRPIPDRELLNVGNCHRS